MSLNYRAVSTTCLAPTLASAFLHSSVHRVPCIHTSLGVLVSRSYYANAAEQGAALNGGIASFVFSYRLWPAVSDLVVSCR